MSGVTKRPIRGKIIKRTNSVDVEKQETPNPYENVKMDAGGKLKRTQVPLNKEWAMFFEYLKDSSSVGIKASTIILTALDAYYGEDFKNFKKEYCE